MSFPSREGKYVADVIDAGMTLTGQSNLATLVLKLRLSSEWNGEQFVDSDQTGHEITSYNYIEKKDGTVNEKTVERLRKTFGWDGVDPFWFEVSQHQLPQCQVTLGWEEYEGRNRLKAQWIDPIDSDPNAGVPKATEEQRRAIRARLTPKLRAISGGSSLQAQKPNGSPKPPTVQPSRGTAKTATESEAWARFIQHLGHDPKLQEMYATDERKNEEWFRVIYTVTHKQDPREVTSEEWARVIEEGIPSVLPF